MCYYIQEIGGLMYLLKLMVTVRGYGVAAAATANTAAKIIATSYSEGMIK
jgi:hypothetical protein